MRSRRRVPERGEEGFTLIETCLTVLIMAIVLACAFPTVPLFFGEQTSIQNTFGAVDQLVLASETVTRFVHEAVDDSPGGLASPFTSASSNAVTFTANTGIAGAPEEVLVKVTNGVSGTRTFGMSLYPATSGSCPPSGSGCTYSGSDNSVLINYLTNGTGGSPVFSYQLQGGESCAGPPPGSAPTTLATALTNGSQYTSVSVNGLTSPVSVGDSIYLGAGPSAQILTATAATAAGTGTKVITVSSFTASKGYPVTTTGVYDNAWGLVPNTLPTTLSATVSGSSVSALPVQALASAVSTGDLVVVGTGATTQTFTVASPGAAVNATSIPVTPVNANATYGANTEVYDSSCSNTQLAQITAVSLNLQATKTPGGQPTGYQSQAYLLSPTYNSTVG